MSSRELTPDPYRARYFRRDGLCTKEGCDAPIKARGLCEAHYRADRSAKAPKNLCACGCGGLTRKIYVSGHNTRLLSGEEQKRRNAVGGTEKYDRRRGTAAKSTYIKLGGRHLHRRVAEQKLGRKLLPGEIVHHLNEDKHDNRPENLIVMTQSEHMRLHLHTKK